MLNENLLSAKLTFDDQVENNGLNPNVSFASDFKEPLEDERELSQHLQVSLKISGNLRDLTTESNVKDFFYARFRRQIVKKNLIDKIHGKVTKQITETELMIRAETNKFYHICFVIQKTKYF